MLGAYAVLIPVAGCLDVCMYIHPTSLVKFILFLPGTDTDTVTV